MSNLVFNAEFPDIWPPDALSGGTISLRSSTVLTYTSDAGFLVSLTGANLTYDADGLPSGGTVTGLTISKNGVTYATLNGIEVDFARAGLWIFGYNDGGTMIAPDPYQLIDHALRGDDSVTGSSGFDDIMAGAGDDTIFAGDGDDYVSDQAGSDVMDAGAGWDVLSYYEANWSTAADGGIYLDAEAGLVFDPWGFTDTIEGFEEYRDTSYHDILQGRATDEDFWVNRGNDEIDGRQGYDWLSYADAHRFGATRGISVNVATGQVRDSWNGTDIFTGIEAIRGTRFADIFTGSSGEDNFVGGAGKDAFSGGSGTDWLGFWSNGWNSDGGKGVTVDLGLTIEVINDGYGNAENANGFENLLGSQFADKLSGNAVANAIWGDEGNDTLAGAGGDDFLFGEAQRDSISGGDGNDFLVGGTASDILSGGAGADVFAFSGTLKYAGVDTISYYSSADLIMVDSYWGEFFSATLVANQFRSGAGVTTANSSTQRFLYNTTTGDLYYDKDGNGASAAVKFATLTNKPVLDHTDIEIWF